MVRRVTLIVFIVLAVGLQVAVCWIFALWVSPLPAGTGARAEDYSTVRVIDGVRREVDHWAAPGGEERTYWHRSSPGHSELIVERAWGWPMLSLRAEFDGELTLNQATGFMEHEETGDRTPTIPASTPREKSRLGRLVPIVPIWPAFVVNTALYFMVLAGVTLFARGVRHLSRRSGGRCPSCGYRLAGADRCPECGRADSVSCRARPGSGALHGSATAEVVPGRIRRRRGVGGQALQRGPNISAQLMIQAGSVGSHRSTHSQNPAGAVCSWHSSPQ